MVLALVHEPHRRRQAVQVANRRDGVEECLAVGRERAHRRHGVAQSVRREQPLDGPPDVGGQRRSGNRGQRGGDEQTYHGMASLFSCAGCSHGAVGRPLRGRWTARTRRRAYRATPCHAPTAFQSRMSTARKLQLAASDLVSMFPTLVWKLQLEASLRDGLAAAILPVLAELRQHHDRQGQVRQYRDDPGRGAEVQGVCPHGSGSRRAGRVPRRARERDAGSGSLRRRAQRAPRPVRTTATVSSMISRSRNSVWFLT